MNLHFAQDAESDAELKNLAAVPYQIISPANNASIVGIYQDSLLGCYRFTRENMRFTPREAMNLLMMFQRVNIEELFGNKDGVITNFDILSQIMPPLTIKYKTKLFGEEEKDDKDHKSNNVIEIRNGKYIRGQMEKGVLGAGSKGLLHRVCNDYGNMASADFIDDLQNIITEYLKVSAYSVGVSDLILDNSVDQNIIKIIAEKKNEVKNLIDQVQLGIFENNTGKTNEEEFETKVTNILNQALSETGKIGLKNLSKDNRFATMVNSGSKGSDLNITFMISCLGQQNVDGKRIPYGFDNRTLPHFTKFDDSPVARGFVESSYINGLSPQELFFHAMGGRIGLIDTAVKSVTWETPIIIIENNQAKYTEIGKWIDLQLDDVKNSMQVQHFTERHMELLNIKNEYVYIPTTDENGQVTWGEVTAITRHDPGTQLYEIKTYGGRSVIVTESKSLLIWNSETKKLVEMLTPDIKVGDCVPVTASLCAPPIIIDHILINSDIRFELNEENGIFVGHLLSSYKNVDDIVTNYLKEKINYNLSTRTKLRVPVESFIAPKCFIIGLLNAYFFTFGRVRGDHIVLFADSIKLIEDLSMLCSRLGIFGIVKIYPNDCELIIHSQWCTLFLEKVLGEFETSASLYRHSLRSRIGGNLYADYFITSEQRIINHDIAQLNLSNINTNETYNDVVLDKIVEINILGVENHPKMYDLTIPTTLNFGLANGLQVRDTSTTGYIQRRLIKGLEDIMVGYDMTLRTNKGKIVQFTYGDDGVDPVRVENQPIPLVGMSIQDIYAHFNIPDESGKNKILSTIFLKNTLTRLKRQSSDFQTKAQFYTQMMIANRDKIIKNVFKNKGDSIVNVPVAFAHIINNVQGNQNISPNSIVDITPMEAYEMIEFTYSNLEKIRCAIPNELFKTLYYFNLSPKELLYVKRFNKAALTILLDTITLNYKRAIVAPGEMVGMIAAQSIGEPTTQMSLAPTQCIKVMKINKNNKKLELSSGEIGKLCDGLIEQLPQFTFNTGHVNSVETLLDTLDHEYYIIGVDEHEQTHWNKISHVSRHPVNGQLMKVTTKSGRMVETTTSHSHLIRKEQKVMPILGLDMVIGMRIPVAKHIDNTFIQENISIGDKEYKLDYLFGWFIGAYLAEGHLTKIPKTEKVCGTICITNISTHFIENTKKFAHLFEKECRLDNKAGEYGPGITTIFSYKPLAQFLLETCDNGSFVKHVPDFAFLAPNEFKAGLIQAYFDGDGNFQHDTTHHQIRVCSRSKQLIKDMALLMNYFDIFGSIKENFTRGSNIYNLAISPKYALLYKQHIGSLVHTNKLDELVAYNSRENIHSLSDDIDRINGLGEIIATCGKLLKLPGQSRNYGRWAKKESIGRRTLEKYIQLFEEHVDAKNIINELCILKQAADSHIIWDEITNIEIYTSEQTEYVYDFTVPGNQTFMTDYGVIVHNTLNSVTYETEIIVRNREGFIQKVQIGEFIEKHITQPKKLEYYKDKDTTYAEMNEYYEIPSCTEDGEILWKEIEAVTRHPVINKDGTNTMLKITTDENREVIATKAKSFLKLINGKIIAADGDTLKVGDYLPVSTKQIEFTEMFELNLKSILSPSEYVYTSEIDKAKQVMHEYRWWMNHANKTFILPYKRSDTFKQKVGTKLRYGCKTKTGFNAGCVYTKQTNMNAYNIPEIIPLDYNFGYLVGAYAAEGCMTRFQLSIANNDVEYFKPIQELCKQWNLTTKIYRHENKIQKGWTSQDLRIYNTVLCRILDQLCGKLSHNKFISDKIIFSNKECLKGFLDAYIGGDGSIDVKSKSIIMGSVSKQMLIDVQQILNNLGIYSFIKKCKKQESNNRGTLSENIHQMYTLLVRNKQVQKLAQILNTKVEYKIINTQILREHIYHRDYEINRNYLMIPNEIEGELVFENRTDDKYINVLFDKIKTIEEVPNTTNYAYDLTIAETRTFNIYNGLALFDTFHFAGVASKSNVTRGVPRIEEILSLSSEPKNPSLTVYLNPIDETDREKAQSIMYMLEHTKLQEIVESIEICFDPDNLTTLISEDADTMEQYRAFEDMVDECVNNPSLMDEKEKSKWIIRMVMDAEVMLEKNITMDDINFTLKNSYEDEISCVYSDYNSDKLVFRIRMNNVINKSTSNKLKVNPLDQSNQIYILKNFQDQLLNNIIIRGIKHIKKVIVRKIKDNVVESLGSYKKQDIWVLDTIGTNILDILALDYIDATRTYSNDIIEIYNVFGIEAARQTIYNELVEVIEFDGTYINFHHLSVLCDRMTYTNKLISIFRHGINNDNIGPIAKASFEETPEMFLKAARHAELDMMRGVSANVMCGQEGLYGTNAFQVVLDIDEMRKLEGIIEYENPDVDKVIETLFGDLENPDDKCSTNLLVIQNNVINIKASDLGTDNNYNPGF